MTHNTAQPETAQETMTQSVAQEITLKIRIEHDGNYTTFILATNNNIIAYIDEDYLNTGKYKGVFNGRTVTYNCSYPEAVEFIGDRIEHYFNCYGINVEFVEK